MSQRVGQHITVEDAIRIFAQYPDAVLTRADGMGWFDQATREATHDDRILTFRTCEALVKRGIIRLRDASNSAGYSAGYWVRATPVN